MSLGGAFEPTGSPVQNNFARFLESFERLDFGLEVPYSISRRIAQSQIAQLWPEARGFKILRPAKNTKSLGLEAFTV